MAACMGAKHVAACIRERMEGYLSGGKVKEKIWVLRMRENKKTFEW